MRKYCSTQTLRNTNIALRKLYAMQARTENYRSSAAIQICGSGTNLGVKNNPLGLFFTRTSFLPPSAALCDKAFQASVY